MKALKKAPPCVRTSTGWGHDASRLRPTVLRVTTTSPAPPLHSPQNQSREAKPSTGAPSPSSSACGPLSSISGIDRYRDLCQGLTAACPSSSDDCPEVSNGPSCLPHLPAPPTPMLIRDVCGINGGLRRTSWANVLPSQRVKVPQLQKCSG